MRILLTGATGFVGKGLLQAYPDMISAPSLRNADEEDIRRVIDDAEPEMILHTAAISDIGVCEQDPEASYRANVLLPMMLAKTCGKSKLICFSSDQVYSGCDEAGPYDESFAKPANTYAIHKLEMESRVLEILPGAVMLRAEWMYDYPAARPNYLSLVLSSDKLAFSSRQFRGVTWLWEVAEAVPAMAGLPGGIYNFGSETRLSMREITERFAEYLGRKIEISEGDARHNLWMNCEKATAAGMKFSSVLDGLKRCADAYGLREKGE